MFRLKNDGGYTIVEVMIFLVITGILMASALLVFQGKQSRTQFTQSVRETESRIRTIVNEVASGHYPNSNDFSCTASVTGPDLSSNQSNEQGTNEGCIFLGKVLHFSNSSNFNVYTIVGLQQTSGTNPVEVTSLTDAKSTIIVPVNGNGPDNTEQFTMPWGVEVTKIIAPNKCGANSTSSLAFVLSLGSYNGQDLVSGSQSADLIPLCTPLEDDFDISQALSAISNIDDTDRNSDEVTVCLESGNGDRQAAIILGTDNNQLSARTQIDNVPEGCNQ